MSVENMGSKTLRSVLESLESGSRPKGGVSGISDGIPSIGAEHLNADGGFCFDRIKYIPKEYASRLRRGRIQQGDVLIVKDGATTGKVTYVDQQYPFAESYVNEHVFICRPSQEVCGRYLFYFLRSNSGNSQIMATFHGAAQGGISSAFVDEVDVPLPPIEDQKRIIEILDAILLKVKLVKLRLDKIPMLLKDFRQSVLSAAYSGQLTESWRNFAHPNYLPMKINDLIESIKYGTAAKCSKEPVGVPILRIPNIQGGYVDSSNLKYAVLDEVEKNNLELSEGDLLLVRSNGSVDLVGRTALIRSEDTQYGYAGYLMRLRLNKEIVSPEFLNFCFQSYDMRLQIQLPARSTTGVHNINSTEVKNLELNVPPLDEQQEIVRIINLLYSIADSMESKYQKAMARIDKIEQSILSKTFCSGLRKV